jgi:hypothetical protein
MSEDAIETWATALAEDALPGEVDLATELASVKDATSGSGADWER